MISQWSSSDSIDSVPLAVCRVLPLETKASPPAVLLQPCGTIPDLRDAALSASSKPLNAHRPLNFKL